MKCYIAINLLIQFNTKFFFSFNTKIIFSFISFVVFATLITNSQNCIVIYNIGKIWKPKLYSALKKLREVIKYACTHRFLFVPCGTV